MGISQTQARDAIKWYHEFDFGNGLKARSTTPDTAHNRARQVFMQCVPIEGENSTHYYCPPFALRKYNSRWISEAGGL